MLNNRLCPVALCIWFRNWFDFSSIAVLVLNLPMLLHAKSKSDVLWLETGCSLIFSWTDVTRWRNSLTVYNYLRRPSISASGAYFCEYSVPKGLVEEVLHQCRLFFRFALKRIHVLHLVVSFESFPNRNFWGYWGCPPSLICGLTNDPITSETLRDACITFEGLDLVIFSCQRILMIERKTGWWFRRWRSKLQRNRDVKGRRQCILNLVVILSSWWVNILSCSLP